MAKRVPKQTPVFTGFFPSKEEEISQYMAVYDLPEYLAKAVYEHEEYIAALADSACN